MNPQHEPQHRSVEDYFTTEEVARELRISIKTVRVLIRYEGLPAYKFGRMFRIPIAEFEKWRENQRIVSVEKTNREAS